MKHYMVGIGSTYVPQLGPVEALSNIMMTFAVTAQEEHLVGGMFTSFTV
jgi:hypothetical protein